MRARASSMPSAAASAATQAPSEARRPTVYSVSPRIMPWLTSRPNGSGVDTTPMSNSTLCQKRA